MGKNVTNMYDEVQFEMVVRKKPKPQPYLRQTKKCLKFIYEVTQEEMDEAVGKMASESQNRELTNNIKEL